MSISRNNPNFTPLEKRPVLGNTSLQGDADILGEYMCDATGRDKVLSDGITCQKAAVTSKLGITLKGARYETIIDILRPKIHEAITTSRIHEKELEEGNRVTEYVSMILTSSLNEGLSTIYPFV